MQTIAKNYLESVVNNNNNNGSFLQASARCDVGALAEVAVTDHLCFSSGGCVAIGEEGRP